MRETVTCDTYIKVQSDIGLTETEVSTIKRLSKKAEQEQRKRNSVDLVIRPSYQSVSVRQHRTRFEQVFGFCQHSSRHQTRPILPLNTIHRLYFQAQGIHATITITIAAGRQTRLLSEDIDGRFLSHWILIPTQTSNLLPSRQRIQRSLRPHHLTRCRLPRSKAPIWSVSGVKSKYSCQRIRSRCLLVIDIVLPRH